MIIEAISFKLALDFYKYLYKTRVYMSTTKINFFDRTKNQYVDFSSIEEMQSFYDMNYQNIDDCNLGDICGIQSFTTTSDLYDFNTDFLAIDVISNLKLTLTSSFDRQRNAEYSKYTDRQLRFINKTISEYLSFYNELNRIYTTGIYSPCYAQPGWSENTWHLKSLKNAITSSKNTAKFPYTKTIIVKRPPK